MSGQPDPLVFFTDRDLGKQFPTILAAAGLDVRRHADLFVANCPDEEWLAQVGANGWIAITHDGRIRYKPNEKHAVLANGVRLLVIVGDAPYARLAKNFVATMDRIEAFVACHPAPWIAKVYRPPAGGSGSAPGSVSMWLTG